MEASIKDLFTFREGRVSNNEEKNGQEEGKGLAISGHTFQCDLFK